jgi:hypothetical protein
MQASPSIVAMRGSPALRFHRDDAAQRGTCTFSETTIPSRSRRTILNSAADADRSEMPPSAVRTSVTLFNQTEPSLRDTYRSWTFDSRAALYVDYKKREQELRSEIASVSSQRSRMQRAHSASSLARGASSFSQSATREPQDYSDTPGAGRFSMAQLDEWSKSAPSPLARSASRAALEARRRVQAMEGITSSRLELSGKSGGPLGSGSSRPTTSQAMPRALVAKSTSTHASSDRLGSYARAPSRRSFRAHETTASLKPDTSRLHLIVVTRDGWGRNPAMETSVSGTMPSPPFGEEPDHAGSSRSFLSSLPLPPGPSWPPAKPGQWSVPLSRAALHQLGAPSSRTYLSRPADLGY